MASSLLILLKIGGAILFHLKAGAFMEAWNSLFSRHAWHLQFIKGSLPRNPM